jgi:hypothetical protein
MTTTEGGPSTSWQRRCDKRTRREKLNLRGR